MKYAILSIFVLHMVILTYLNNSYLAGLPFRSYLMVLCGGLVVLEGSHYFTDLKVANLVYGVLAVTGIIVSLYNTVFFPDILRGSIRLFQSWLITICSYYLLINFGYRAILYPILLVAIPSSIVGILQSIDLGFAWDLRAILGGLQNTETIQVLDADFVDTKTRPPGLTLFAITQVYLLFTAIALSLVVFCQKMDKNQPVWLVLAVIFILYAGMIASETRSAIGAGAVMIFVTFLKYRPASTLISSVILAIAAMSIQAYISTNKDDSSRVLNLGDKSAKGRAALYKYGLELAVKKPVGYGYSFDSVKLADEYFMNEKNWFNYNNEETAQFYVAIHNAVLNVTHVYGVLGMLVLIIYVFNLAKTNWFFLLVLGSYLVNSFFHNAGILNGDLYIDVFIAVILFYKYRVLDKNTASALAKPTPHNMAITPSNHNQLNYEYY